MINTHKLYFFLIVLLCGCQDNLYEQKQILLQKVLLQYKFNENLDRKVYIVTGLDACGACLDYTVKFIEANINDNKMYNIISGSSVKKLKGTFRHSTLHNPNFIFDSTLTAMKLNLVNQEKPLIYFCKNGNIIDCKSLSYKNADSVIQYINTFKNL